MKYQYTTGTTPPNFKKPRKSSDTSFGELLKQLFLDYDTAIFLSGGPKEELKFVINVVEKNIHEMFTEFH